jgi:cell division protein FtsQ
LSAFERHGFTRRLPLWPNTGGIARCSKNPRGLATVSAGEDRGRLASSRRRPGAHARADVGEAGRAVVGAFAGTVLARLKSYPARLGRRMHGAAIFVASLKPKGAGVAASALLIVASAGYGIVRGDHVPPILDSLRDVRDAAANAAGFRVAAVALTGHRRLSDQEVLAAAGVTERTSLMFLDVDGARRRLESVPWIAQATVRKFYPGRLEIALEEREAFALWQNAGKISVIAADGTVLGAHGERHIPRLPLVVGPGAAVKAQEILALIDLYPAVKEQVRAAIRVADRRWNLRLKNGLDVRLPETDVARALDLLVVLDRDKKLISRDLTAIDLRLPDRVTVRLSDDAAAAREQAEKEKLKKKAKPGPA